MDNVSGLPDDLLVKILSFLPTDVAVSTSVLSKRWQFLWMWLPKIDYDVDDDRKYMRDAVNKNLRMHRAPVIESLHLLLSDSDIEPEDLKLWVELAASRFVRELGISCDGFLDDGTVPNSLFACKSLVILKLKKVWLTDVPSMVCLPSLKSLKLNKVAFADGISLQELLSNSPVLEDLDLKLRKDRVIDGFTVSHPSLQKLSLCVYHGSVSDGYEINTPSLKYLKLEDKMDEEHYSLFKNMPELKEADIDVACFDLNSLVGSITSVKRLTIHSEVLYGDGFVFNQLEHLELRVYRREKKSSKLLAQLLKDSPTLRELDIYYGSCRDGHIKSFWGEASDVPECLLSSLQIFKWTRYSVRPQDRDLVVYILKNARHLKKARIATIITTKHENEIFQELTLAPRASVTCELVFVDHNSRRVTSQ